MTTATTTPNHEAQQHQQQQKLHKEDEMNSNSVASDFNTMPLPSAINNSSSNLNEIIYGPETVQMELLLRVADLQTRLSTMELFANPQFDANEVLISELNHMADQLDKLIGYTLNTNETQSLQSSSTSSSPAPHTTVPKPAPRPSSNSASVSDLPASCWKDLNIFKLSDHTSSSEQKPVKNTTDSGVLSSPSSLPRSDHGRLSSISPLQSPIAEDSLSGLESVYFELMQHYNKIKEMPMTPVRAEQLYNLMKRLYDLALTAENRSSIIASPEELERIFQLDGDTRKLSENLERAIALQKQLSNYQNSPPNSESNSLSSHEETNLHKDNNSTTKLSSVSLASYARKGGSQNIKKVSVYFLSFLIK
ncbi:unnamed protein product [Trichobilharzia regenti]|nr:unnamed protein product [Trichobilharzia regenti]